MWKRITAEQTRTNFSYQRRDDRYTPETTQTGPTINTDILNAVAQIIGGQWKALSEKMGLKDTIEYVEESRSSDLSELAR